MARRIALGSGGKGEVRPDTSGEALERHLTKVRNWASEISFLDLKVPRPLNQSFVDLDLEMGRLPTRSRHREERKRRVSDLLRMESNLVILGDPGAGKTTSLKRLAAGFLWLSSTDPSQGPPLLVRLRDLRGDESLAGVILEAIGVELVYEKDLNRAGQDRFRLNAVTQLLSTMRARVLVDGVDELHPHAKLRVLAELRQLLLWSSSYRVIVTCRTADFTQKLEKTETYTIEPLSDSQIELFAQKWLGIEKAKDLLLKIRETPYGGSEVLPLTLAHLCAIYQRTGSVPEKPRTIYRKIVRLLLEEWDEQRSVERSSAYANFQIDRKEEFLRAIAFELTLRFQRGSFDHTQIERAYRSICESFALPKSDCRKVVREIESHTGLILEVAYERFDFAHKSIQEYLAAEFILRLPKFPTDLVLRIPNELALVVAMSSDPAQHFRMVADAAILTRERDMSGFSLPFLRRLFLERVDFRPNSQFGRSVADLFAATFYPSLGEISQLGLPFQVSSRVFREFASLEGVSSALAVALRQADIAANGGETWRLRWRASKEILHTAPDEGIVVDSSFLQLAGWRPS